MEHPPAMAFRIHDSVVRGEIDNRTKGIVRGRIWIEGRAEPVVLELQGDACADLAGCLLTFTNPLERIPHQHLNLLNVLQRGSIGNLTASRKVCVFDVPLEEALAMIRRKEKPPEHLANSLYLEWFSEANGRVVIESADYELRISAPEWRMSPEEEENRAEQAASGMNDFLEKLSDAIEEKQSGQKEWDEHDYEKFFKDCDARDAKLKELMEKYGDSEEARAKIADEMGWSHEVDGVDGLGIEEMNAVCGATEDELPPEPDPSREGIDWIRTKENDLRHPLQHRCSKSAWNFSCQIRELALEKYGDQDLEQFIFEFRITGVKLAGALHGIARGENRQETAFIVAYLKRALDHLHKSHAGLEAVVLKKLLPEEMIKEARNELFEIREGILRLMSELRDGT